MVYFKNCNRINWVDTLAVVWISIPFVGVTNFDVNEIDVKFFTIPISYSKTIRNINKEFLISMEQ